MVKGRWWGLGGEENEARGILPQRLRSVLMLKPMTTGKRYSLILPSLKNILCSDDTFNHE